MAKDDEATEYTEHTEYGVPRIVQVLARMIPAGDRESILGDLLEDAGFRRLAGARRDAWIAAMCAVIAAGLSVERARGWLVMPPVRDVVSGFAVDDTAMMEPGAIVSSNPLLPKTTSLTSSS